MTDLPFLTVAEASDLIRTKKLSPVEYAEALFAQVDRYDAALDAFILPMRDVAMAEAKRAQEEVAAGNWRGPFHGVPYGLKDIVDVEGVPTTAHSKILEGNVARRDAAVTRALPGVVALRTRAAACGCDVLDLLPLVGWQHTLVAPAAACT